MSHLKTSTFPGTYEILFDALDYEQAISIGELHQGSVRASNIPSPIPERLSFPSTLWPSRILLTTNSATSLLPSKSPSSSSNETLQEKLPNSKPGLLRHPIIARPSSIIITTPRSSSEKCEKQKRERKRVRFLDVETGLEIACCRSELETNEKIPSGFFLPDRVLLREIEEDEVRIWIFLVCLVAMVCFGLVVFVGAAGQGRRAS
ncbi:uncharacterized protein K489DRAFT_383513 [Dissoconium aciculare CBS 342.82]|uniref:Uncharacterized protein n=1 Tax=Dissoconium aciculare CBS 342.82 TaxID=1314786 RepID=A0A6J3LW11_9PEZI|nr:uncharacterized protein K489DRAFT_383513 [Dissoconium aciculare CBS 342.82]KAF1819960.1 hypothetical protein K489DRAFT_383513 [Dissoconium aciculare CBS 342.82]